MIIMISNDYCYFTCLFFLILSPDLPAPGTLQAIRIPEPQYAGMVDPLLSRTMLAQFPCIARCRRFRAPSKYIECRCVWVTTASGYRKLPHSLPSLFETTPEILLTNSLHRRPLEIMPSAGVMQLATDEGTCHNCR